MVRRSFTAVIEKNSTFRENFETEPYEAGWAREARWFIRAVSLKGALNVWPQVSPDGLFWCDEAPAPLIIPKAGLYSIPMANFGHWLRLRVGMSGENPETKVLIYLALKE